MRRCRLEHWTTGIWTFVGQLMRRGLSRLAVCRASCHTRFSVNSTLTQVSTSIQTATQRINSSVRPSLRQPWCAESKASTSASANSSPSLIGLRLHCTMVLHIAKFESTQIFVNCSWALAHSLLHCCMPGLWSRLNDHDQLATCQPD